MSNIILDSLPNCKVLSTISQEENYELWKAARSRGIGGSEIGAICGVSNYATARTVYLRKTSQYDEDFSAESLERMRWGHVLEPFVADEFARRSGKTVVESPATLVHKDHKWAIANVDRFIVDEHGAPYGILECKTAGNHMAQDWEEGEIPMSYIYQLNWYLWITGLTYGAFACLVGGNKFYYYEVFRNDELLEEMVAKGDHFWNVNVKQLIEPPLTGSEADTNFVKGKFEDAVKGSEIVLADDSFNELAEYIKEAKADIKTREKQLDEAMNKLKEAMGPNETAYTTERIVKWTSQSQQRVDTEVLKTEFPEVYEAVKKTISFRKFMVK